jgi:hypothetical protein
MIKNTIINRKATQKVAKALGHLNQKVIYVGGGVVSFYIDDPAAEDVRPTKDIDISLKIASVGELEKLRQDLNQKGLKQLAFDEVMCRFRLGDIIVDVMATKSIGWAPGNRWFEAGFNHSESIDINGTTIRILPVTYYLASKLDAFNDRGGKDPRTSHDFEDIVYLLNYTSYLKEKIEKESDSNVRKYIIDQFHEILKDSQKQEAILANLYYENQIERFEYIIELLKSLTSQQY